MGTDECSLPSKELGTVSPRSLSRLENFNRQVSGICACEDFCDGEGTRAEDEPVVCAGERTRLGNPTGLGSPMSPCKPGFESVTDFEWTRSLGEISSPKQASVSPSAESANNQKGSSALSRRLNGNACPQRPSCGQGQCVLYPTAPGLSAFRLEA